MKLILIITLIFCILFTHAEVQEEDGVLILTDDNFDEQITKYGTVLVKFYAPWCGHCKKLAPEYSAAAKELKELTPPVIIGQVDCTVQKDLAQKYEIQGFPTLKLFKNGKVYNYESGRTKVDIVNYMKKHTGPLATELTTHTFDHMLTSTVNRVILVTKNKETVQYKLFEELASQIDDTEFYYFFDTTLAMERNFDMETLSFLVEGDRIKYNGQWVIDDLVNFIHSNELPPVIKFTQESARKLFGPQQSVLHQILLFGSKEQYESVLADYTSVALSNRGNVLYIYVPPEEGRIYEYFGIDAKIPMAVMGVLMGQQMKKYKFPYDEYNKETFGSFSKDFYEGKIDVFLKSEDVPESQEGPVIKIVGKSFDSIALDTSKHVFIKFYAPWCGHCKALAPIFVELAEKLKSHDDIIIAEYDATANEVENPDVVIKGYPTLKLFRAGDNKVIDFDGERDLNGMMTFLKDNIPDFVESSEL